MPGISVERNHVQNSMSNNLLLLANNILFAAMLVCPMIPGAARYFTNTHLCLGIILLLSFLNYRLYKILASTETKDKIFTSGKCSWKLKAKIIAWAVMVPTVMLVGFGPITNPLVYPVDKFTRVFGVAVINDYSVSKEVHYYYYTIIIYGLLILSLYQNIFISLINNQKNKIKRLGEFSYTLLVVGWSFLLVCVYRQFSGLYSHDLTLCLLKFFLVFMIPAFYLLQTGRLTVQIVRIMLAFALLSIVLSLSIVVYFDIRNIVNFSNVLATVLLLSMLVIAVNEKLRSFPPKALYSKIVLLSFLGSCSLVFFSLFTEFSNILAFRSKVFINTDKALHIVFCCFWLTFGYYFIFRKFSDRKIITWALPALVLGVALIQGQPSLIIKNGFDIFENANYAVPVSDFLNFGKIPLFENFPGHGISAVISSVVYGVVTSDYKGANFTPWVGWLYFAICVLVLYCFIKSISNGLVAVSAAVFMPYVIGSVLYYGVGLAVLIPFFLFAKTFRKPYLVLTVFLAVFLVAYRLDIGFAFLAGILCSSLLVSIFFEKKFIKRVLFYFVAGGAAVFVLFLVYSLIRDINPLLKIQQYLAIASSSDHWGYASLGDTEKTAYTFFYFVIPVLSMLCFFTVLVFRSKFSIAQFTLMICLIFAYYANLPRILVRHSLVEYGNFSLWMWTIPFAVSYLISRIFGGRALIILSYTVFVLLVLVFFQSTIRPENSTLQNALNRAWQIQNELTPGVRVNDIKQVNNSGSRVVVDVDRFGGTIHANEIKIIADTLLSPGETFFDFTNQSASYAWSGRENPAYVVQPPSMMSGEKSQRLFLREAEPKIDSMPIVIMPANNNWYFLMQLDGIANNIRHYLVAEWIYNNYRPLFKYNDFASVWVLNSRYVEFYNKLMKVNKLHNKFETVKNSYCHDCVVKVIDDGLLIQPTGSDPYLLGFEKLIDADQSVFDSLTLKLGSDNNDNYQIFFSSDKVVNYEEKYSLHPQGISSQIKFFDFSKFHDAGHINSLRLDVPETENTLIKSVSTSSLPMQISKIDWGYDNFVSMPIGGHPSAQYISNAHNYNVQFLPYIWGQFDSENAASHSDLAKVLENGGLYSWSYVGHEHDPAYLRIDLTASKEFIANNSTSYLLLGSMDDGGFNPLCRFEFKLKEGRNVYLFRISSDYYWSLGKLKALSLGTNLVGTDASVRILEGD